MFVTCAGHQGLSVTTAQRRKGGPPKGPPAFSHESTRRNVCRRNTSCSREQHQCRSAGRSCAHTTHSPAAWRCRRSSGSLDHRASPRRSHASASRRRFLAAYSRSFAFAFASAPLVAYLVASTERIPADVARPPADRRRKVALRVAKDCREIETKRQRDGAIRSARNEHLINRRSVRVGAGSTGARHQVQTTTKRNGQHPRRA